MVSRSNNSKFTYPWQFQLNLHFHNHNHNSQPEQFQHQYLHIHLHCHYSLHIVLHPEIVPEIIEWGPLCIADLFQNKSVACFNPKKYFRKFLTSFCLYAMHLFSADAKIFQKKIKNVFLPTKSWKNHSKSKKKSNNYGSWEVFFSAALTAQNSPELQLRFINSFI